MFKALGVLVALYTVHAIREGEVYAKSGIRGRRVSRDDAPTYFWAVIVTYAVLALALMTVF